MSPRDQYTYRLNLYRQNDRILEETLRREIHEGDVPTALVLDMNDEDARAILVASGYPAKVPPTMPDGPDFVAPLDDVEYETAMLAATIHLARVATPADAPIEGAPGGTPGRERDVIASITFGLPRHPARRLVAARFPKAYPFVLKPENTSAMVIVVAAGGVLVMERDVVL